MSEIFSFFFLPPGVLDELYAVIFPGAYIGDQYSTLGAKNYELVKRFVERGGRYLGFCSGAFLATQDGFVGCNPKTALVPEIKTSWTSGTGQCEVEILGFFFLFLF